MNTQLHPQRWDTTLYKGPGTNNLHSLQGQYIKQTFLHVTTMFINLKPNYQCKKAG